MLLISPQAESNSVALAKKFDAPMVFLRDPDNRAARQLGNLAEGGLPMGMRVLGYDSDVPMPAVLITDAQGVIVYSDLTDDFRTRPESGWFLAAVEQMGLDGANCDVILAVDLTCPACGGVEQCRMPTDACVYFHACVHCGTLLKPLPSDCCVFCSYGSVSCPGAGR